MIMKQFNLVKYLENPNQKIITKDGKSVRIICADREASDFPIVALIKIRDREGVFMYSLNGQCCDSKNTDLDLFFVTEDTENEEKTVTPMATTKVARGGISTKQFNLEEYLKNPHRKIVTKDGKSARIICTDRNGLNIKPIAALITIPDGYEIIETYWENGVATRGYEDNPYNLFFATEKKSGWLNVYTDDEYERGCHFSGGIFNTKEEALEHISSRYTYADTVKIEWEE